jgi:hypothetical protein
MRPSGWPTRTRNDKAPSRNKMLQATFRCRAAIARRSQRRLSRIAKGLRTRCYSPLALARKGDGRRFYISRRYGRPARPDFSDVCIGGHCRPACGGRALSGDTARPAGDLHAAGLASDLIEPVALIDCSDGGMDDVEWRRHRTGTICDFRSLLIHGAQYWSRDRDRDGHFAGEMPPLRRLAHGRVPAETEFAAAGNTVQMRAVLPSRGRPFAAVRKRPAPHRESCAHHGASRDEMKIRSHSESHIVEL